MLILAYSSDFRLTFVCVVIVKAITLSERMKDKLDNPPCEDKIDLSPQFKYTIFDIIPCVHAQFFHSKSI